MKCKKCNNCGYFSNIANNKIQKCNHCNIFKSDLDAKKYYDRTAMVRSIFSISPNYK